MFEYNGQQYTYEDIVKQAGLKGYSVENFLNMLQKDGMTQLQVDKELSNQEQFENIFYNAGLGLQEAWVSTKIGAVEFGNYLGIGDDQEVDDYVVDQYVKLEEIGSKMESTGKGIVGGFKEGDVADTK